MAFALQAPATETILSALETHMQQNWRILKENDSSVVLEHVNKALDLVEELIKRCHDIYLVVENDLTPGAADHLQVSSYDMTRANQLVSPLLLKIISGALQWSNDDQALIDRIARVMSRFSGRGAVGDITYTWHFLFSTETQPIEQVVVQTYEPAFSGSQLGLKTWGAAPLLAKLLVHDHLRTGRLRNQRVLELGTGTGLVGLVCDKLGAVDVHVTDYDQSVLANVQRNVEVNQALSVQVSQFDFVEYAHRPTCGTLPGGGEPFDVVVGSDLLYEMDHAEALPVTIGSLLPRLFIFMIPLRSSHQAEVTRFEQLMAEHCKLTCSVVTEHTLEEEAGLVRFRYYEYTL